jgi:hypothetical protein
MPWLLLVHRAREERLDMVLGTPKSCPKKAEQTCQDKQEKDKTHRQTEQQ